MKIIVIILIMLKYTHIVPFFLMTLPLSSSHISTFTLSHRVVLRRPPLSSCSLCHAQEWPADRQHCHGVLEQQWQCRKLRKCNQRELCLRKCCWRSLDLGHMMMKLNVWHAHFYYYCVNLGSPLSDWYIETPLSERAGPEWCK